MLVGVYVERTVTCPECEGERSTKAPRGITLSCPHCGASFRAPAPPASTDRREEAPDAPAGQSPAVDPAPVGKGPARVSIDVDEDQGELEEVPAIPRAPMDPPPQHPLTEVGKVHGAKGGRSRSGAAERYRTGVARRG